MKNILKSLWLYVGSVILVIIVYLFINNSPGKHDSFAECLTEKNVKMYGTDWCPHCKAQKAMFRNSFKKINYINCDKKPKECVAAGVEGYPTWVINGKNYIGVQSLEYLSKLSGCKIDKT